MVHDVDDVGDLRLKARIEDVRDGPEDERRPVPVGKRKIAQKPGGEFQPETYGQRISPSLPYMASQFFVQLS